MKLEIEKKARELETAQEELDDFSRRIVISDNSGEILTILDGFRLDLGVLEAFREDFVHFAGFSSVFPRKFKEFWKIFAFAISKFTI